MKRQTRRTATRIGAGAALGAIALGLAGYLAVPVLVPPPAATATILIDVDKSSPTVQAQLPDSQVLITQITLGYSQLIPTSAILDPVIKELNLDLTASELAPYVAVGTSLTLPTITVSVSYPGRSDLAAIANAVSVQFVSGLNEGTISEIAISPGVMASAVLQRASEPTDTGQTTQLLVVVGTALLGAISGGAIGFLATRRSDAATFGDLGTSPAPTVRLVEDGDFDAGAFIRSFREASGDKAVLLVAPVRAASASLAATVVAQAEAGSGKRVLLIDADLRSRELTFQLGVDETGENSFVSAISGGSRDAIETPDVGWFLPAGEPSSGQEPADTIRRGPVAAAFSRWRREFDVCIVAAPPLLAASETFVIIDATSASTILVVAEGVDTLADVRSATALLNGGAAGIVVAAETRSRSLRAKASV